MLALECVPKLLRSSAIIFLCDRRVPRRTYFQYKFRTMSIEQSAFPCKDNDTRKCDGRIIIHSTRWPSDQDLIPPTRLRYPIRRYYPTQQPETRRPSLHRPRRFPILLLKVTHHPTLQNQLQVTCPMSFRPYFLDLHHPIRQSRSLLDLLWAFPNHHQPLHRVRSLAPVHPPLG